jgi:hypothetical protein
VYPFGLQVGPNLADIDASRVANNAPSFYIELAF